MSRVEIRNPEAGVFTGRHMLAVMVAFFGVIIAVNVTMAWLAGSSWTGMVVENSYVASQQFNGKAEAGRRQAALGFTPQMTVTGNRIVYALLDRTGAKVPIRGASARFHRPVSTREDTTLVLGPMDDGAVEVEHRLSSGIWMMEIIADIGRDQPWREAHRIVVGADGRLQ